MILIKTFGYRWRKPSDDADVVVDCRGLRNPYRDRKLRYLDGTDERVQRDVIKSPGFVEFFQYNFERICEIAREREPVLVEVGCFGGKHRSVAVGEMLMRDLKLLEFEVELEHTC